MAFPADPRQLSSEQVESILKEYLEKPDWAEGTRSAYLDDIGIARTWSHRNGLPNELCLLRSHVQALVDDMIDAGKAPSTVRRRVQTIRRVYDYAYTQGVTAVDLSVTSVSMPARDRSKEKKILEIRELREIVRAATRLSLDREAVVRLMALYGPIYREISHLTVGDLHERQDAVLLNVGTGDAKRLIPLDSRTADLLRKCRGDRRRGPLLRNQIGGPMAQKTIASAMVRASELAGIERKVNAVQVRATMIRYAIDKGIPGHEVAKSLGLQTLRSFEDYLPPGREVPADIGIRIAEELAPDPVDKLSEFIESKMNSDGDGFPAAGLCALIGLLAEYKLRSALRVLEGEVRGTSGGTLMNLQGAVISRAKARGLPVNTLGRDVSRLANIRDTAAHGHLYDVSIADAEQAYKLLDSIERDLQVIMSSRSH